MTLIQKQPTVLAIPTLRWSLETFYRGCHWSPVTFLSSSENFHPKRRAERESCYLFTIQCGKSMAIAAALMGMEQWNRSRKHKRQICFFSISIHNFTALLTELIKYMNFMSTGLFNGMGNEVVVGNPNSASLRLPNTCREGKRRENATSPAPLIPFICKLRPFLYSTFRRNALQRPLSHSCFKITYTASGNQPAGISM